MRRNGQRGTRRILRGAELALVELAVAEGGEQSWVVRFGGQS